MPEIAISEVKRILSKYAVKPIRIKKSHLGLFSSVFFITTKNQKLVLKSFKENTPKEFLASQLTVLEKLERNRITVETVLPSKTGEKTVTFKNRFCWLCTFLNGKHVSQNKVTKKHVKSAIGMLARIHKTLYPLQNKRFSKKYSDLFNFSFDRKVARTYYAVFFAEYPQYQKWEKKITTAVKESKGQLESINQKKFKVGIIHNDFSLENLLFDNSAISGVLDFGLTCKGRLVSDLASALTYLCVSKKEVNTDFFKYGVKKYISATKLNKTELKALKPLMVHQLTIVLNYYIREIGKNPTPKVYADFENYLKMFDALKKDKQIESIVNSNQNAKEDQ